MTEMETTAVSLLEAIPWRPHPEVWMLVVVMIGGYWWLITRIGPLVADEEETPVTGRQVLAFVSAVGSIWLVSDWPLHDIAEEALLSVHMIEHLVLALIVPPLILFGIPQWAWRLLLEPVVPMVRRLTHPVVGLFSFNVLFAVTHWPPYIGLQNSSEAIHFLAHAVLILSAFLMFWPVFSPLPELPRMAPAPRIGFLFLQTILPTVPASFLTFTSTNLYPTYAGSERLWGLDPVTDQQAAGILMKLGGGLILWLMITVVFVTWVRNERAHDLAAMTADR
jgi:putative membrane protein